MRNFTESYFIAKMKAVRDMCLTSKISPQKALRRLNEIDTESEEYLDYIEPDGDLTYAYFTYKEEIEQKGGITSS